jgi:putative DNA-invertase from lambdoid prophage Rac
MAAECRRWKQANEGESLDVQRRQIEGYALMHGLTIIEVMVEEGVSGSIPVEQRPIGGQLFARLQKGDIVVAAKLDRLFRSALDALKVVESLKGRGVKLHLLDLGGDIAGNGVSNLFLTIAAAFAEAELRPHPRAHLPGEVRPEGQRALPWRLSPARLPAGRWRRAGAA